MSIAISIQFLTGRYHATPWDKQVNEGVVEWPPSPWRILRSLVAAYYRLAVRPERSVMLALMGQLAEYPPSYVLPDFTAAHTRHFMPLWKEGKATTTKVLDTFYALPGGALSEKAIVQVCWSEVCLKEPLKGLLEDLCAQVGYLGRAESWVEMRVVEMMGEVNARPIKGESEVKAKEMIQKVLVPLNASGLRGFVSAIDALPRPKKGRGMWTAPGDVLEVLELDVGRLHEQGWHGIPGSDWALYAMETVKPPKLLKPVESAIGLSVILPSGTPKPPKLLKRVESGRSRSDSLLGEPTIARFRLTAKVLPKITAALSVGERFHRALMRWSRDGEEGRSARVFSGRNEAGEALRLDHDHAWYLPECNDRGEIVTVVVYTRGGFDEVAVMALRGIKKVWGSEGFDIGVELVFLGRVEVGLKARVEEFKGEERMQVMGCGRLWRSLTPFVLTRFPKCDRRGNAKLIVGTGFQVDGPEDQALRLLRQLGQFGDGERFGDGDWLGLRGEEGEVLVRVRLVDCGWMDCGGGKLRFPAVRFQRVRGHGAGAKSLDQGFWLEVKFGAAAVGPMALGYGAHFGLGVLGCCAEG